MTAWAAIAFVARVRGGVAEEAADCATVRQKHSRELVEMSRTFFGSTAAPLVAAALALFPATVSAQTVKIGIINSYSGFVAQAADQMQKGMDLYVKEHEKDLPPGVKIEIIKRDDTSNPEVGKRIAQELIARDQVQLLTGIILS